MEVLTERAVKMTNQILNDERLFDNYDFADEVQKEYLLADGVNKRRRPDSEELGEVIQMIFFTNTI